MVSVCLSLFKAVNVIFIHEKQGSVTFLLMKKIVEKTTTTKQTNNKTLHPSVNLSLSYKMKFQESLFCIN